MKTEATGKLEIEHQLAARTLAATVLASGGPTGTDADIAALQDLVRWLTTAFRIVHRRDPSAADLATIVQTYAADRALVGQAVRNAAGSREKREASHCHDWVKSPTNKSHDHAWLKTQFTNWCRKHPEEAGKALTPLTGEARARAAEAAGWKVDPGDAVDGSE